MKPISSSLDTMLENLKRKNPDAAARLQATMERSAARIDAGLPPVEPLSACTTCGGTGLLHSRSFDPTQEPPPEVIECPHCTTGAAQHAARIARLIGGSGMEEFRSITFSSTSPTPDQASQYAYAMGYASAPRGWLWVGGTWHSGKTRLALCIGNWWLDAEKPVLFREEPTMFDQLRSAYDADQDVSFAKQWDTIMTAPLLIIDDFGKAKASPWVDEKRFTLSSYRLEHELPTIITTNLEDEDMERDMPRLAARVLGNPRCFLLPMNVRYTHPVPPQGDAHEGDHAPLAHH